MHRQAKTNSTLVPPPRFNGLPKRPDFDSNLPPMHRKPRQICRNFIYGGVCDDKVCPRAHVPNNEMIDLFHYLLEREDCPMEVRFIRSRFTRPFPGRSRTLRPSDRICSSFLECNGSCSSPKCRRAHLSPAQIYNSLLQPMKVKSVGLEVPPAMPFDPTTAPEPVIDGDPVVNLPEKPNYASRQPSLVDNLRPHLPVVQIPKNSIPARERTATEFDAPDPRQCSAVDTHSVVTVCLPQAAELPRASSDKLPETESQQDNSETPMYSQDAPESPIEPTLDSDSAISGSNVADACGVSTPTTTLLPSNPLGKIIHPPVCRNWLRNRCRFHPCKYLHQPISPPQTHGNNTLHTPPTVQTNLPLLNQQRPSSPPLPCAAAAKMTTVERDPAVIAVCIGSSPSQPKAPGPLHLQQKPASAVTSALTDTLSSQAQLASKLQEQPPLSGCPPREEVTLTVMEPTKVKFSSGFSIEKITTGFESLWFVIEDVSATVDRTAIERLVAPFGEVQEVRLHERRQNDDSPFASRVVSVRMANYRQTVRAINGLDGKDPFGHRITVRLSLGKSLARHRDKWIRVSWPIPRKAGYAGYSTLEAAQNAVSKADGTTERGYWITATMYESIPIIDAYNVRFMGLPPEVDQKFLDKFGPSEGTMLERPNYQAPEFGIPAVRRTLASFGKITQFQVVPAPYKSGFVRVWCQFDSPDVAGAACELNWVKQRSLGMEKILVRRVHSVIEHVPRARFLLVEHDLLRLQEKVWNHTHGAHLDILAPRTGEEIPVRLVAEDSKTLARLRVEFKEILDGEVLKESGQQIWDDFLRSEAGLSFVEHLGRCNPNVMILVQSFRRCVRLIGTVEQRQPVAAAILAKLCSLRQHKVHTIPLDGQAMGVLASPEFVSAQQRHGEENIRIDFQRHVLLVRGPANLHEEVQQIVHAIKSRHATDVGDDHCPVCLEPPLAPVSLSCSHRWCKACLVAYLTAAADTRSFPISCLGNQGRCTEFVPVMMAREVLSPADFDALALAAFHAYVQARPGEYRYCPTPDCLQAYPNGPQNAPLSCPSCLARICSSCHVEYHEGVTCADREDGGDRLFQEWMRTHDVKKCPGCNAPIERAAGCHHMTCTRCHTHTCWVCLETFAKGQGIYDHMREFHGGIGL
ncbi:hypothetical protein BJV74DRAFT_419934 [Russula compacta]|nr:hypothetical protein BJV74DRAFT_419934 [Russula compacta]